jgi:hypothetical protein
MAPRAEATCTGVRLDTPAEITWVLSFCSSVLVVWVLMGCSFRNSKFEILKFEIETRLLEKGGTLSVSVPAYKPK